MYLLGVALSLFCTWYTVNSIRGDWDYYFDTYTILIYLSLMLAILITTNSFKVFYYGMRGVLFPTEVLSEEMRGRGASLFRLLSKTVAFGTAIGVLISLIGLLFAWDWHDPNVYLFLGTGFPAVLSTAVIGLFLIFAVLEPAVFILKKRSSKDIK